MSPISTHRRTPAAIALTGAPVAAAAPAALAKGTEVRTSGAYSSADPITATATRTATGQKCSARLVFPA